ncbi:MAG: phosphatidate cytidylyltransferase [Planctomycetota bacterium]|nr:phosphatidate cytidylyltransferase [Planctomycetota bacterium]
MRRVLTAAVLLSVLVAIAHFGSHELFVVVVAAAVAVACDEAARLFAARGGPPFRVLAVVGGTALVVTQAFGERAGLTPTGVWLATLVAVPLAAMALRENTDDMAEAAAGTLLPIAMIAWPLSTLVLIRAAPAGQRWIYLLFICTILADTAAYYVGRAIGKRKLAPAISPNKTWAGAFGGMAAAVLGAVVACTLWIRQVPPADAALLGAAIGFAAILGDLMESMLKRHATVKDTSNLLPGHGGLLDRMDSLLFSAPLMLGYLWLRGL